MISGSSYQQTATPTQQFAVGSQTLGQQPNLQQVQQILGQLEQAESRHAQILQQIQAEEQFAATQLQQLRAQISQLSQGTQFQQQPIASFPRV